MVLRSNDKLDKIELYFVQALLLFYASLYPDIHIQGKDSSSKLVAIMICTGALYVARSLSASADDTVIFCARGSKSSSTSGISSSLLKALFKMPCRAEAHSVTNSKTPYAI